MEFDFVIVGGGSAGCVLANRLSEDPRNSVCLIEAGPRDRSPLIQIPAGVIALMRHKTLNWRYVTARQEHASGRAIYIPRGRALGGSSSINGMVYMRGHPFDYDDWAALGNPGWSFREVLPYFRRSENNEIHVGSEFHGTGGPLNVCDLSYRNPLSEAFLAAAGSLQLAHRADFNAEDNEGFGHRQVTIRKGRRESSATAFLDPARRRGNLAIITGALVDRVEIENGRAVGVELLADGARRTVAARCEVLVAAGAIASPLILMRSGIGPAEELRRHGIPVSHALAGVGRNLQDHCAVAVQTTSPSHLTYGLSLRALPWLARQALLYAARREGFIAGNMMEAGGFAKSDPRLDRTDLQYGFMPGLRTLQGGVIGAGHGYTLTAMFLRPKSRGCVSLSGADAAAPPVIDPKFWSAPEDLDAMLKGLKLARRITDAPAFDRWRGRELTPGPDVRTDEELRQFIRDTSSTVFHPVGTCKMGNDADAVVDAELRVRGLAGLRVVDASIMPVIVGGNTHAPVVMIAEKAADMILGRPRPFPVAVAYGPRAG